MLGVPSASAVTTPPAETDADAGSELLHDTARPSRTIPAPSRSVAIACVVPPITSAAALSCTDTVATALSGAVGRRAESELHAFANCTTSRIIGHDMARQTDAGRSAPNGIALSLKTIMA